MRSGTGRLLVASEPHLLAARSSVSEASLDVVAAHAFSYAIATRVQKYRSLFAAIRWWRRKAASLWCETPFLDVGLDENEAHLTEIDMYLARSVCSNRGKEVLCFETVCDIIELLAVASEEERSSPWSVADANDISLYVSWTVCGGCEWLVVSSIAIRAVGDGRLVVAYDYVSI